VDRTRLGYEVLVKLKVDELLLRERPEGGHPSLALSFEAVTPEDKPTSCASAAHGRH
jgi:hypothetical protein